MKYIATVLIALLLCVAWVFGDDVTPIPHDKLGIPFKRVGELSLEANGFAYYELKNIDEQTLPIDSTQTLFFMVTPIAGDVDLYVRLRDKPVLDDKGHCQYCLDESVTAHGDYISIPRNSEKWPTDSNFSFYILVKGAPDTISSFTLTVWISDRGEDHTGTVIALEDGFPQVAVTLPMQYTYFKFRISDDAEIANQGDAAHDVVFILTPFNGDPDIFVSTDAEDGTRRPTSSTNFWRSLTTKTDTITVTKSDVHYTRDGFYYIGIKAFGFSNPAYFMISATSKKRYTLLIESVGVEGLIPGRLQYNYFKYYMPVDKKYELLIAASQIGDSDPDLFVYPELDFDANAPPSDKKCKWCHQQAGDDNVIVPKDDARKGYFYIGVRSWRQNTAFSLLAITERNNVFLRDGIPSILPATKDVYKNFKFFVYDTQISGVTITATSVPGSKLKLFYSKPESRNTHPTQEKHDMQGYSTGNAVSLMLYGSQPIASHYLSVLSDTTANITVTASTNTSATILQNQIPLPNIAVSKNTYRYFIFDPSLDDDGKIMSDIIINLGVLIGEADLYVSADETRPTKEKCDEFKNCWFAETFKADAINLSKDDPKLKDKTRLYISMVGLYYETSFVTIMAAMSGAIYQVSDGVPIEASVAENSYSFYSFHVSQKSRVTFQLSLSDDATEANLYASKNVRPTKVSCEGDNSCYISERIGDDIIDQELEEGMWYISVLGVSPKVSGRQISYQFKASSKYHIIQPSSRIAPYLVETTTPAAIQQIKVSPIFQSSKWLTIATSLISGHTKLYLNPSDEPATPENHKYKASGWPNNIIHVEKTAENEDDFKQAKWTLGVEALEISDYWLFADFGSYYIPSSVLPNNIPRSAIIVNNTRHFTVDVDSEKVEDIFINLRVMSGSMQLFINQNYTFPTSDADSFYSYIGSTNTLIRISKTMLAPRIPLKIAATFNNGEPCVFELTVSRSNQERYVVQDQPQSFYVDDSSRFVVWGSKSNPKKFVITLESNTMEEAPEFYVSSSNQFPTESNYEYKSRSDGQFRQVIYANSQKQKYHVYVPNKHKGLYASISATSREESTPVIRSSYLYTTYLSKDNGYKTYRVVVPRARLPKGFEDDTLTYELYTSIAGKAEDKPVPVNMKTVGGIQHSMHKIASITTKRGDSSDIEFKLPGITDDYVYQVNAIVHNGQGLQTPYDGFWIVNGDIYPDYPNFIQAMMVAPGTILLLIVVFGFSLYFLIGSMVNVIRGKKGFSIIPNRKFWMDLPYLVADGFLLIVTCGRRSTARAHDDDLDNDIDQLNLGARNARAEESDEDLGGYGAI